MTEPCHGVLDEDLIGFGSVLEEIVDTAIAISGADFGNIQLIDPKTSDLRIVAHRGFPKWWLDFWNNVSAGHGVCGTALACGKRVIVEDVEHSPIFIGTPALEIQLKAGVRAVQSTPIVTREGKPLGMFSTHYKKPQRPDERGLLLLDLLARQAAEIIQRKQAEAQIQALNAELEARVVERTAQLQAANEALLQSNTELKHFAHATAHDLQTPLRSIAGFTQLLQQEVRGRGNEQVDAWSAAVVENTKRLQVLIQEILSYTRLETQGRPFEMTDLKRLFDEVVASLAALIGEARAEVTGSALPTLTVDRTQMAQVLQNLIENGIKYNRSKPPRVAVAGELQDDWWVFSVTDNGIGIDPKHFDRVFALFQRLHPYHEFPGTGIGVPLCRRIVERHGGHMWIESRPGEGSTFYFSLPADRNEGP